jgi:hypothetical protein
MKNKIIYLLLISIFFSCTVFSQTLTPFVTEGNTWVLGGQAEPGAVFTENWKIQGDTILSGISYKNIFRDNVLQGFVRQTDKLVYFKPTFPSIVMLCDTQEVVLYNFNSIAGDIINYTLCDGAGTIYQQQLVTYGLEDSFYLFGFYRNYFFTSALEVREDFGSFSGPLHLLVSVPEWFPTLTCFNNTPRFFDSASCTSATFNPSQIKEHYRYNNPVEDNKLRLHTTQVLADAGYKIYIYDNVGRLISASQTIEQKETYEQNIHAPNGLYYLVLKSKLGVSTRKFVLQN